MKKVFVIENMNDVDPEIAVYLNFQKDWDITIQGNLESIAANELVQRFVNTDAIALQSLFVNSKQFTSILTLIETAIRMREKPLEIYILYGHKHFETFINTAILITNQEKIIKLLKDESIKLFDIVHEEYEI